MDKKNLLSIGEISKFTGASPRSLRYYERLGLLEPAFIDPDSGYRYYAFDQVRSIEIIKFCIELDIPLKMLEQYMGPNGVIDVAALAAYGKQIAEEKLKTLKQGLDFIHDLEESIALAETYHQSQKLYTRDIPEKFVCIMPIEQSFNEADHMEVAKMFLDWGSRIGEENLWWEFGLLCEHTPSGISRCVFMELREPTDQVRTKVIPAGTYFCTQHAMSMIEHASEIFKAQLRGQDSFLTIETEIFTGRHKISEPVNELRVIALS